MFRILLVYFTNSTADSNEVEEHSSQIFYVPTFPELTFTNYLPDFLLDMHTFYTEKYALRVNFLILIVQTGEFYSGVSIISYFVVSFCYKKKNSVDCLLIFPSNTIVEML
jgi:hypothetical protein